MFGCFWFMHPVPRTVRVFRQPMESGARHQPSQCLQSDPSSYCVAQSYVVAQAYHGLVTSGMNQS